MDKDDSLFNLDVVLSILSTSKERRVHDQKNTAYFRIVRQIRKLRFSDFLMRQDIYQSELSQVTLADNAIEVPLAVNVPTNSTEVSFKLSTTYDHANCFRYWDDYYGEYRIKVMNWLIQKV